MLLQSLIETPEEVDRAAVHHARLSKLMLEAGGIAGPGSIGMPAAVEGRPAAAANVPAMSTNGAS
jgi:hypothetical protein